MASGGVRIPWVSRVRWGRLGWGGAVCWWSQQVSGNLFCSSLGHRAIQEAQPGLQEASDAGSFQWAYTYLIPLWRSRLKLGGGRATESRTIFYFFHFFGKSFWSKDPIFSWRPKCRILIFDPMDSTIQTAPENDIQRQPLKLLLLFSE